MATGNLPRHHGKGESRDIGNTNKKRENCHTGHLIHLIKAKPATNKKNHGNNTEHAKNRGGQNILIYRAQFSSIKGDFFEIPKKGNYKVI